MKSEQVERERALEVARDKRKVASGRAMAYVEFTNMLMQRATCTWAGSRGPNDDEVANSLRAWAREIEKTGQRINRESLEALWAVENQPLPLPPEAKETAQ